MRVVRTGLAGLLLLCAVAGARGNDSDASVGVGGVQLKREPRISMEKERLTISLSKITVEYEFLNTSDHDITTEVAFPIPPYEATESAGGVRAFDDFKLWVDGQPVAYETEAKAFLVKRDEKTDKVLSERDVTAVLQRYKIDIPSIGHYLDNKDDSSADFVRLPVEDRKKLSDAGLFEPEIERAWPWWEVRKIYHWRQTFPAHKMVRVRHEYRPGFGFEYVNPAAFDAAQSRMEMQKNKSMADISLRDDLRLLDDSCVEPALRRKISAVSTQNGKIAWDNVAGDAMQGEWVDYILKTANNWKTPIKNFELVVERGPQPDQGWYRDDWDYASFCWDGPVKKVDAHRFEATATDFVPKRDLKVLFFSIISPQDVARAVAAENAQGAKGSSATEKRQVGRGRIGWMVGASVGMLVLGWWGMRRVWR